MISCNKVRRFSSFRLSIFFRIKTMVTHNNWPKNKTWSGCVYEPWDLFFLCYTHHLPIPLANLVRTWVRANLEQCMKHGFWPSAGQTFTLTHFLLCVMCGQMIFLDLSYFMHLERYQVAGLKKSYWCWPLVGHPLGRCGFHCLQIRDTGTVAATYERRQESHHELESGFWCWMESFIGDNDNFSLHLLSAKCLKYAITMESVLLVRHGFSQPPSHVETE